MVLDPTQPTETLPPDVRKAQDQRRHGRVGESWSGLSRPTLSGGRPEGDVQAEASFTRQCAVNTGYPTV